MADVPRVFLSYSHDSDEHADRVLALADALCDGGIDVILDRYVHPVPAEGWPRWMEQNLDTARFVLMVCTETYRRRAMGLEEPGKGLGVDWEGNLIYNTIYRRIQNDQASGSRFIPILLPGSEPAHIPNPILGYSYYRFATFDLTDPGFEALYRHLTDQPATPRPGVGSIKIMPSIPRPPAVTGPLPPSGGPWWNVPYQRNPHFTGREAILAKLEAALAAGTPAAPTQAIGGLGGVGKTQTAVEFAYRHRDRYRAILWVRADTETDLTSGYRALAEVLGLPEKDESDSNKVAAAVRRWLGREPGHLLILDNADRPALVEPYLPPEPKGHILLTSRAHDFQNLGIPERIELPELPTEEATEFLLGRCGRQGAEERDAAWKLARELGGLPLALEQAAAYIMTAGASFQHYLESYRCRGLKLLDAHRPALGKYPESVVTTWAANFVAAQEESPAAADLLRFSAFLAPDAIPFELLTHGAHELGRALEKALAGAATDPLLVHDLLNPLARYSLVHIDGERGAYDIHHLVQEVLKAAMDDATRHLWAERAVQALNRRFPDVRFATWPPFFDKRLVPHALAARRWIKSEGLRVLDAVQLLNNAGWYLYNCTLYAEAELLHHQVLTIREQAMGPDHPDTALSLNDLGVTILAQDRYDEAKPLFRRALKIREAVLGPNHPDTATSLNNLAQALQHDQGRPEEAEPLFRRALEIREAVLGPDHPDTARTLKDLTRWLRARGRDAEAEQQIRRALEIRQEALDPDHPNTARTLSYRAQLLRDQGRPEEAEPLFRRALEIREAVLGPDHPDTATSLSNLAELLWDQGRPEEAEPLLRRALTIREKALGPKHPDTLGTRHSIARWTGEAGDAREALRLYRELLPDRQGVLGPDHPDTLRTRHHIARWTGEAGDAREALRLYGELLPDRQRVQGPNHPDTLRTRHHIAHWTGEAGDAHEALRLYRELLPDRQRVQGPDHPDTLGTRHHIAHWTGEAGDAHEALRLYRELLLDRQRVLGPDHPDTLRTQACANASK